MMVVVAVAVATAAVALVMAVRYGSGSISDVGVLSEEFLECSTTRRSCLIFFSLALNVVVLGTVVLESMA